MSNNGTTVDLLATVFCPHCWHKFSPDQTKWIATHQDLLGDDKLPSEKVRFLPTRFTVSGHAIDRRDSVCKQIACPNCHLEIQKVMLEMTPLFASIFGAPFCGKSNFLTAMVWKLKTTLRNAFKLDFASRDPLANAWLDENQVRLFNNPKQQELVFLDKTQQAGELYQPVLLKGHRVNLPRPLIYSIGPDSKHPAFDPARPRSPLSRVLCMYDNAGEQFMPGGESAQQPCTHLAISRARMFLFDPTQHPRFRNKCSSSKLDPQFRQEKWLCSQDQVLAEAARRIRSACEPKLSEHEKIPGRLIVMLSKFDSCQHLLHGPSLLDLPVIQKRKDGTSLLRLDILQEASDAVRRLLGDMAGEIVNEAEGAFQEVLYVPVSALGRSPQNVASNPGAFGIRPCDVNARWTEIPLLFALSRAAPNLVTTAGGNMHVVRDDDDLKDTA